MSLKKIIEYALYLLVFLLPWQTRFIFRAGELNGGYSEYSTLSVYATDLLLLILSGLFIVYKLRSDNSKLSHKFKNLIWHIMLLDIVFFISIFYSINRFVAVERYIWFVLGAVLFWMVAKAEYNKIKFIYAFLAGVLLQSLLGIWQFLSQSTFACKFLGVAEHLPGLGGSSVLEVFNAERWLRAYGSLDHPNIMGGYMVIAILLLAILILHKDTNKLKDTNNKQLLFGKFEIFNLFFVCALYLVFCIFLMALFFSFSRSAWLGLILGIFTLIFLSIRKKDIISLKKIWQLTVVGAVLILLLVSIVPGLVSTRIWGGERLEIKSNVERVESYRVAKEIIQGNWFLGVGIGNYTEYVYANVESNLESWDYQPVHNVFLLIWAEIGIIGLAIFLSLILYLVKISFKSREIVLLIAMLPMLFFDHWLWSLHFGGLMFWLVLGIIFRLSFPRMRESPPSLKLRGIGRSRQ